MGKTVFKLSETDKEEIKKLALQGKDDQQIANKFNVTKSAISYWRKKYHILSPFTYEKFLKINKEQFEILFYQNLSDYSIAKELGVSPAGVYNYRKRHHYIRTVDLRCNPSIALTKFQIEVLIGTLLGDSSIRVTADACNPRISCAHGIKQKEYCEYKTQIFKNLGAKCVHHKRNKIDERTGIYYEDYTMSIPANPEFLFLYQAFYTNKDKKSIPISLLENFTEVSLAFLFMDDGTKSPSGYKIATNCFDIDELKQFQNFLKTKWNLETTIHKDHGLYIKAKSASLFKHLVSPYMHKTMTYKL